MSTKLEKLQELIKTVNESLTREEFLTSFKTVIDVIKKTKEELAKQIESKTAKATSELEDFLSKANKTLLQIEQDNKAGISNIKKWALERVSSLYAQSNIDKLVSDKLSEVDAKLQNIIVPDTSTVALEASKLALDEVLPLIPPKIDMEVELPKLGEPIRDALELLQGDERLDKSAIKGLQEELDKIIKMIPQNQIMGGGGVGKQNVYYYDLSSSLDGVTKTFPMPAFARILDVKLSSAAVLRPTIDWTSDASALTITFTSQIDANPLLNSGQSLIILYAI